MDIQALPYTSPISPLNTEVDECSVTTKDSGAVYFTGQIPSVPKYSFGLGVMAAVVLAGCAETKEHAIDGCSETLDLVIDTDDAFSDDLMDVTEETIDFMADISPSLICGLDTLTIGSMSHTEYLNNFYSGGRYIPPQFLSPNDRISIYIDEDWMQTMLEEPQDSPAFLEAKQKIQSFIVHEVGHFVSNNSTPQSTLDNFSDVSYDKTSTTCSRASAIDEMYYCWNLSEDAVAEDFVGNDSIFIVYDDVEEDFGSNYPVEGAYGSQNASEDWGQTFGTVMLDMMYPEGHLFTDSYVYSEDAEQKYNLVNNFILSLG